ncbi:hypothetical protein ABZS66_42935 [Dactylosporangium sp. NPDC005572]|uniref:hypothetical protein n=1 Tax=Dactylosporangium sp. NPDC005572 TaxID=3156889 RepID=UPI0033B00D8B
MSRARVLAVDVGGTKFAAAVLDAAGTVHTRVERPGTGATAVPATGTGAAAAPIGAAS